MSSTVFSSSSSSASFGTKGSRPGAVSSTGWRPSRIRIAVPSVTRGRT
jgi:hypothetical protein